jgi:hypothetical protein
MSKSKITDATLSHYAPALNRWRDAWGVTPTAEQLATIHAMPIRPGSKHALACAMYLRDEGATDDQVKAAVKLLDTKTAQGLQDVLHNYRRRLETQKLMRRDMSAPKGVFKITLTKAGEKQRDRYAAGEAKKASAVDAPAPKAKKAKAKRKAKAAPVAEAAPVDSTQAVSAESVLLPASDAQIS